MQRRAEKRSVGVVLVNWNGGELTIPCIGSLLAGSTIPDRIVVVDNASTDGSADQIASQYPNVVVIRNEENTGFTGGNNVGISRLLDEGMDYIWVLNNDTEVEKDCLKVLVEFMEREGNVAGCCGKILYHDRRDIIWYAGAKYYPRLLTAKHIGESQKDGESFNVVQETLFITGCSMFVRAVVWRKVGLFDDRLFAYSEDFDWCLRAKYLGLHLNYVPQAVIYHKISSSMRKLIGKRNAGTTSPLSIYLTSRNRLYIIKKHSSRITTSVTAMINYFAGQVYYLAALILLMRWSKGKALVLGIWDGLFDKMTDPVIRVGTH